MHSERAHECVFLFYEAGELSKIFQVRRCPIEMYRLLHYCIGLSMCKHIEESRFPRPTVSSQIEEVKGGIGKGSR